MAPYKKRKFEHGTVEKLSFRQFEGASTTSGAAARRLKADRAALEIQALEARLEESQQTERNNEELIHKYKTLLASLVSDHDALKQRYDDSLQATKGLEKQHAETVQQCRSLQARLDHSEAEHATTESRLRDCQQRLELDLKNSHDGEEKLQSLQMSCADREHNNKQSKGRMSKPQQHRDGFQTATEAALGASNTQDISWRGLHRPGEDPHARRLRRENQELRGALISADDQVDHLRAEMHDVLLALKLPSDAGVKSVTEAIVADRIELSRARLEHKRLEISHAIETQKVRHELDNQRKQCQQTKQLQQVIGLMRDSHDRATRSLHAVLSNADSTTQTQNTRSFNSIGTQTQTAECRREVWVNLQTHAGSPQEDDEPRHDLLESDTAGLVEFEDRYRRLTWQHKSAEQQHARYVRESNKRIEEKTADLVKCAHAITEMQIRLAATDTQNSMYSGHLYQQSLKLNELTSLVSEKDLTISHLRSRRIATGWHHAAIRAQRDRASLASSTASAELETQCREADRLNVLLQTATDARVRAETSRSLAETELRKIAERLETTTSELQAARAQEAKSANEIDTLKSASESQLQALRDHGACAIQKQWLDERYQEKFDEVLQLRKQLIVHRPQMIDCGTDAVPISPATRGIQLAPTIAQAPNLSVTPKSLEPAPWLSGNKRVKGRPTMSPLSVKTPVPIDSRQLPSPPLSRNDLVLPRRLFPVTPFRGQQGRAAPPTQPRNFDRESELCRSYREEWEPYQAQPANSGRELFPHRRSRAPSHLPVTGRPWSDTHHRRSIDAYRPR